MMQQTKTYKLNLIETSDTFSPDPLNENMEKVEAAISAEAQARAAADAAEAKARADAVSAEASARASAVTAMSSRVTTLEARKFAWGSYKGNSNQTATISVGFTPGIIIIIPITVGTVAAIMVVANQVVQNNNVKIVDNGFSVTGPSACYGSGAYCYLAIA